MKLVEESKLRRTCGRCFNDEVEGLGICTDSPDGRHRFERSHYYAGVVVRDFFGLRSGKAALRLLLEECWGPDDYATARQLTPQEVHRLVTGEAEIRIEVRAKTVPKRSGK